MESKNQGFADELASSAAFPEYNRFQDPVIESTACAASLIAHSVHHVQFRSILVALAERALNAYKAKMGSLHYSFEFSSAMNKGMIRAMPHAEG